ncbi:MAG: hypothetical protein JXA94_07415 [Parachlamydiales bacterium]|nr:hypothetical protein [Parachlamydiales bacterium]
MSAIAQNQQNLPSENLFFTAIINSGIGYLTARIFTSVDPIAGAAFRGSLPIIRLIAKKVFNNPIMETILSFAAGLYIANLVAKVTLFQALTINVFSILTLLGLTLIAPIALIGTGMLYMSACI